MPESAIPDFASNFLALFYKGRPDHETSIPIQSLSLEDAYRVQDLVIQLRLANGERVAGYKVGCTSRAIREQFGLQEPICGRLIEPHVYRSDTELRLSEFTSCALEPEFVLHIGKDISDSQTDDESLLKAIDFVSPGMEVHNYKFWFGEPTSQELIASNGIHACLVIGEAKVAPNELDLAQEEASLFIDDELVASAAGHEIMSGGPLASLRWLIGHLTARGDYLRAGQLVIPGSPVRLIPVAAGSVARATLTQVGSVRVKFV
jgi:2-keto-4-pentenoate hydratase